MKRSTAHVNAIGTAVPDQDVHQAFIDWAELQLTDRRAKMLFRRMASRAGINHRWSALQPTPDGGSPVATGGFYGHGNPPPTSARMDLYAEAAPVLALKAIADLSRTTTVDRITHLVVASCTGFVAPGIDQIIAGKLGLSPNVERTLVGFMGCYAAVAALRLARSSLNETLGRGTWFVAGSWVGTRSPSWKNWALTRGCWGPDDQARRSLSSAVDRYRRANGIVRPS